MTIERSIAGRARSRSILLPTAFAGAALVASLLVAAPAAAKEPLRPRGSEPVAGTPKAQPAQPSSSSASRGDRGRRAGSRDGTRATRYRGARGDRRGYRVGDRHRDLRQYRDQRHHRRYRDGRHHRSYRHHRYGYYPHRYYRGYGFDRFYRYRYRPYYYAGYYPFSVYSVWGPWWYGPSVSVDLGHPRYSRGYGGRVMGALDLDVSPEKAQIFIDGDYVGVADEYDGFPSYLWLEEGTYDVAIYHEGYETLFRQYTIRNGLVIDITDDLERGEAVHPDDHGPTTTVHRDRRLRRNEERRERADRIERSERERDDRSRLSLAIWPEDAAVYLNGHFVGTGREVGALLQGLVLEAGQHTLEVVRPGYGTDERQITVAPGQTLELEIDLEQTDL